MFDNSCNPCNPCNNYNNCNCCDSCCGSNGIFGSNIWIWVIIAVVIFWACSGSNNNYCC